MAAVVAISLAVVSSAGARTLAGPEAGITGVAPTHAVAGQLVTISGTGLDGTTAVTFGTIAASSMSVDPNGTHALTTKYTPAAIRIALRGEVAFVAIRCS